MTRNIDEKSTFSATLSKLLVAIGVQKLASPKIVENAKPEVITLSDSPTPPPVTTAAPVVATKAKRARRKKIFDPIVGAKFQQKMVQTDPYKCQVCEIRSQRKFKDEEVQCENKLFVEVSVQVSEEDFQSPLKSILKNKSLACLTPAEILAQEKLKAEEAKKNLFSVKKEEEVEERPEPKQKHHHERDFQRRGGYNFDREEHDYPNEYEHEESYDHGRYSDRRFGKSNRRPYNRFRNHNRIVELDEEEEFEEQFYEDVGFEEPPTPHYKKEKPFYKQNREYERPRRMPRGGGYRGRRPRYM